MIIEGGIFYSNRSNDYSFIIYIARCQTEQRALGRHWLLQGLSQGLY